MSSTHLFPKIETLEYWVRERESIRQKRVEGRPKPWTEDPILQSYRFCNVHREDDAVTVWIKDNVRQHQHKPEFPHFSIITRQLNLPSSINAILKEGWPYEPYVFKKAEVKKILHDIKDRGGNVFNAAYIVSTNGVAMDKIEYLAMNWVDHYKATMEWHWFDLRTLADAHLHLVQLDGISNFMAGQIIADLKHTGWLNKASDWWTWCTPGPGSMRGLSRIMGYLTNRKYRSDEFIRILLQLRDEAKIPEMCLQDLQNCLCEVDKYMRAQDGGKPKQHYPGR